MILYDNVSDVIAVNLQVVHLRVPMKNENDVRKVVAALQLRGVLLILFTLLFLSRTMQMISCSLSLYSVHLKFSKDEGKHVGSPLNDSVAFL